MAYAEIRDWIRELKPGKSNKDIYSEYGGIDRETLLKMYRAMVLARRVELEEKTLLRKGFCRFFIGCGGKELIDVVAAQALNPGDPHVGYYRNKAFDLYRGVPVIQKIYEAVGDRRAEATGGMLQAAHSSYPELGILPQASPTGSHALEAAGLGEGIKNPTPINGPVGIGGGRFPKDSIVNCCIGEGSTSSPEFHRAVFYSVYNKTPNLFAIYNCGWAISTSVFEQFPEGNPTTSFEGFQRFGLLIENFEGTEIKESIAAYRRMVEHVRSGKGSAIANINVTREDSHSGSDDQAHYMEPEMQRYHIENDPLRKTAKQMIDDGIFTPEELGSIYSEIDEEVARISAEVTADIHYKKPSDILTKVYSYKPESAQKLWDEIVKERGSIRAEKYKEFHKRGFFPSPDLPENLPPMNIRTAINYTLFDIFMLSDDTVLFGQDVADFVREIFEKGDKVMDALRGKGGVFLTTKHLQRAFGMDRVFNTQLDEAGILGRAIGHAYQGRVPFPEIQFIDYMSPAYQQLKDRIATTYQRSNAKVKTPMVIRTSYGGYKQGAGAMWHSEANLGTYINIPGLHVAVPSNAADAVGLLRTAYVSGDPVLYCEAVALYNRRDWDGYNIMAKYPSIEKLIPFGKAEVYNPDDTDMAIISYGITLPMTLRVAEQLAEQGIKARVLDLRTVKPIDWEAIETAVRDCSKVMIVSEDRFHGGVGPTISAYIADQLFEYLDSPVRLITAQDARVAYGPDGDEACIPQQSKVLEVATELAGY
ncbi:MAG: transketolase C-terminal domain-containing protein [candidate division Zixibacteria bacterium]